jgi:myo-inositol 2-dehydrogenase / D-chiro-inositol 1-dehydrogenase
MKDRITFGVLGGGRIGKMHAENLLFSLPKARLAAVADPFADTIAEWAEDVGVPKLTPDAKEVISDPEIDAVIICSPTDTHADYIIECAEAGKQILCEKPISFDVKRTKEALKVARDAGVKLQIGFNRRFDTNAQQIHKAVASGKVGEPHIVRITSRDPAPPPISYIEVSGGIFVDMMIHDFDMSRFISCSEVTEIYATGACLIDPKIGEAGDVDTALVTLKFANGAVGVIDNSRAAGYGYDQRMEVFGSKGSVESDNRTESQVIVRNDEGVTGQKPLWFFVERYKDSYLFEIEGFIEAVINNTDVAISGEDGLKAVLIALAATESRVSGKPVVYEEFIRKFD